MLHYGCFAIKLGLTGASLHGSMTCIAGLMAAAMHGVTMTPLVGMDLISEPVHFGKEWLHLGGSQARPINRQVVDHSTGTEPR